LARAACSKSLISPGHAAHFDRASVTFRTSKVSEHIHACAPVQTIVVQLQTFLIIGNLPQYWGRLPEQLEAARGETARLIESSNPRFETTKLVSNCAVHHANHVTKMLR
jgi:hypothetical protein